MRSSEKKCEACARNLKKLIVRSETMQVRTNSNVSYGEINLGNEPESIWQLQDQVPLRFLKEMSLQA
jgi:hypothetical protein